ncbi:Hypothetical_protein [Hexamita inflata]|uniref:Hypothetical_protein n=1 Tax=Hexamita inflata TaxID=28002 RepID=A0AA86N4B7_9EUKA|nr:Hypothetical protein HINF_LOCUS176 [Hexamita inflata]
MPGLRRYMYIGQVRSSPQIRTRVNMTRNARRCAVQNIVIRRTKLQSTEDTTIKICASVYNRVFKSQYSDLKMIKSKQTNVQMSFRKIITVISFDKYTKFYKLTNILQFFSVVCTIFDLRNSRSVPEVLRIRNNLRSEGIQPTSE